MLAMIGLFLYTVLGLTVLVGVPVAGVLVMVYIAIDCGRKPKIDE